MFTKIIRNASGTYEIRRWSIYGYGYWGPFENGYWWPAVYRKNSLKSGTPEDARQAFLAARCRAKEKAKAIQGDVVVSNISSR